MWYVSMLAVLCILSCCLWVLDFLADNPKNADCAVVVQYLLCFLCGITMARIVWVAAYSDALKGM